MLKQTTNFNVSVHLRAIFQKSFGNSMILPAALSGFLTWTMVGGRRFRPSVAVVNGRRFRPTFGHLEVTSMSIVIGTATIWQQSELSVEERNPESVVECKAVSLRIDGYCCMNVHVPKSFRRETRPVVLRDEKRQSVFL